MGNLSKRQKEVEFNFNTNIKNTDIKKQLTSSKQKFEDITILYLSENLIGAEGVKCICNRNFINLKTLDLYFNNIGSEGVKHLSHFNYPHLKILNLQFNKIGNEGVKYLAKAKLVSLSQLMLGKNQIGAEGSKLFSTFKHLKKLNIINNDLSNRNKFELTKIFFHITKIKLQS